MLRRRLRRWLLGDRLHPGGAALTDRLIDALGVGRESLVADVACGPGASALQAAARIGCRAISIDLSPANVERAQAAADAAGLGDRVRFLVGDAERLPLDDASVDGVLCDRADARLRLARTLGSAGVARALTGSIERGRMLLDAARRAIGDGVLGYGVVLGRRR